jgi:hypothetical protein
MSISILAKDLLILVEIIDFEAHFDVLTYV